MDSIKILYIDDKLDTTLSEYLDKLQLETYHLEYDELTVGTQEKYIDLLNNSKIKSANIIIIDSKLFEDGNVTTKFTGEEIKLILNKISPFIEVIIISQNDPEDGISILRKYDSLKDGEATPFYDNSLRNSILNSVNRIEENRKLIQKIQGNDSFEKVLVEKIENSLNGISHYDELEKSDIDNLISEFKKLEEMINGK